jgi:hypothetical protein
MALFPMFLSWCANIFVSLSNILLESRSRLSNSRKQLTYSSSSVSSLSELLLSLLGVVGRSGLGVPFSLGLVGCSGDVPAGMLVAAGRLHSPLSWWVLAGLYRSPSLWALAGSYWRVFRGECWFHPQIHPRPGPSKALQCCSYACPFLFPGLMVLGVEASWSYWGMEVV